MKYLSDRPIFLVKWFLDGDHRELYNVVDFVFSIVITDYELTMMRLFTQVSLLSTPGQQKTRVSIKKKPSIKDYNSLEWEVLTPYNIDSGSVDEVKSYILEQTISSCGNEL